LSREANKVRHRSGHISTAEGRKKEKPSVLLFQCSELSFFKSNVQSVFSGAENYTMQSTRHPFHVLLAIGLTATVTETESGAA